MSKSEGDDSLLIRAAEARAAARDQPEHGRALATAVIAACGRGDAEAMVVALRTKGWAEREIYLYDESRRSLNRAVQLARTHGLSHRLAESLISRSSLNLEVGRSGAALRDVAAARVACGGRSTLELDSQEALIEMKFGNHAAAVEIGLRARAAIDETTDPMHQAVILINLGESLSHLGRWREADHVFGEAAVVGESLGRYYFGLAVQTHAAAIVRAGRLSEGLAAFDRSEALMTEANWPLGEHYLERIESLATLGLVDEADDAVRRASDYFARAGMGLLMFSEVRLRQARLSLASERFDDAAEAAAHAAKLFRRQRRPGYAAQSDLAAVDARLRLGRGSARDLRRAERASVVLSDAGSHAEALDADLVVARLALRLGRIADARERLAKVEAASRSGGSLLRLKGSLATGLAAGLDGDGVRLRRAARRGLDELSRFRSSLPTAELRALASTHGVELATMGLRSSLRTGRVAPVFDWMERGRLASVLVDVPSPRDESLDGAFARLREVLSEQRGSGDDGDRLLRLRAEQAQLETRIQRRLRTIRSHAAAASKVARAGDVLDALPGSMLELAASDGRLVGVVLGPSRRLVDLGPSAAVAVEVEALRFALRRILRSSSGASVEAARAAVAHSLGVLDRLTAEPIANHLAAEVVVVPTAALFGVPWHALPTLAERRVSVAPSATVWLRAQDAKVGNGTTLVAAGPRLAAAAAEAEAIGALHPGSTTLVPPDSTVSAVRAGLDGAGLAHLACHGSFRADNPSFSSLELSDGPLTLLDMESLSRAPDRVVMASCDSGASQALPGDELRGFLSALFMLGTRTVVASAVPVPDLAATPLMLTFHERLRDGRGVADSLASARENLDTDTAEGLVLATAFTHFGAG